MSVITLAGPSDSVPTAEKVVVKGDMNYIVSKISEPNYENAIYKVKYCQLEL